MDACMFTAYRYQSALRVELSNDGVDPGHNHGRVIWEDYVICAVPVYLVVHF